MIDERWRPVLGFPDYEVSDHGRIKRHSPNRGAKPGRILRPQTNAKGYLHVTLSCNNRRTTHRIAHMVLEAFVGTRPRKLEACHSNGDKTDNRVENLRWDTPSANVKDRKLHDGYRDTFSEQDRSAILRSMTEGKSYAEIARILNRHRQTIRRFVLRSLTPRPGVI